MLRILNRQNLLPPPYHTAFSVQKMPTRVPEDYVFNQNGGITLYFQVGEVGDLLDGNVTARFTPEEIREINAQHPLH